MPIEALKPELRHYAEHFNPALPSLIGTRFTADGVFLPQPGNTVVCHLKPDALSSESVLAARNAYRAMASSGKLAFTAASSLHMTLFQGIIEFRRKAPYWPDFAPLETPIAEMTALFRERLAGFEGCAPFKVRVTGATPEGLVLDGVDEDDRAVLAAWRDALAGVFGYRHPDHDAYRFHITFAYRLAPFTDDEILQWQDMLDGLVGDLQARFGHVELTPPAYCAFNDMNHFQELLVLEAGGPRAPDS